MEFKILLASLAISSTALAQGGSDPISGIDIIIKKSALCHPRCDENNNIIPIAPPAASAGDGNISAQGRPIAKKTSPVLSTDIKKK